VIETVLPESRRLYLHGVSGLPSHRARGRVPGLDWLPERALVMAGIGDLVCLPCPVDEDLLGFLNGLGVGPAPEGVVVPTAGTSAAADSLAVRLQADRALLERIAGMMPPGSVLQLHPYASTAEVLSLAGALEAAGVHRVRVLGGAPEAAERADRKHTVRAKALELGVPVAEGEVVELPFAGGRRRRDLEPVRAAVQRQLRHTGRVIVRGSEGVAGSSTFVVGRGGDDTDGLIRRLGAMRHNRIYLVEALVDLTASPNLRLNLGEDGTVTGVATTDQRWGGLLVHAGNVYPSASRLDAVMEGWARTMAGWLHAEGFAGDMGLDFVEYRDPRTGVPDAFLAEVNPRVNGAHYPLALRERINAVRAANRDAPVEAFASGLLETDAPTFAELCVGLGRLLFSHETGQGLVPYAAGPLADRRCAAVALAPSSVEAMELYARARAALESPWAMR
jgi:hypothetical protein